jgi:hypothetical protein
MGERSGQEVTTIADVFVAVQAELAASDDLEQAITAHVDGAELAADTPSSYMIQPGAGKDDLEAHLMQDGEHVLDDSRPPQPITEAVTRDDPFVATSHLMTKDSDDRRVSRFSRLDTSESHFGNIRAFYWVLEIGATALNDSDVAELKGDTVVARWVDGHPVPSLAEAPEVQ